MCRLFAALALGVCAAHAEPVTFYKHVAPIIYQSCAPCHRPGEPGPFPLLTYDDVRKHRSQIVAVIQRHFMPPWLPAAGYGSFQDERRLTDQQIRTIEEWVQQGAAEGTPGEGPPLPRFVPGWQLGKPDLVIEAAVPFHLPADGPDQYWNFVLRPKANRPRWVKAVEVRPGNLRAVHHANLLIDMRLDHEREVQVRGKVQDDGFPGMDVANDSGSLESDSHFLFWKPGGRPPAEPAGMAWRLDPGADLVLNVHMRPTGKPETVQPSIGLYFAAEPATKHPMLLPLEHDGALDIPAGAADFLISDDFVIPMDMDVLAVYPHAHYLGHLLEGYATLPGGTRKWLIRIPDWDPNWQAVYHYKEPVFLPKGTVVSMRYHYDNSAANPRNPNRPPQRVRHGNQATDEMAHLSLQVLPRGPQERGGELHEAIMRHRLEKYPGDFIAQYNLGSAMLERGNKADAIRYLRGAVAAQPDHPMALDALGTALFSAGNVMEAGALFERALRADAGYAKARFHLALALAVQKRWEPAVAEFRKVLAGNPGDAGARQQLGLALREWGSECTVKGELEQAATHWRDALNFRPDDAQLHNNLGAVLARLGRFEQAVLEFEAALRLDPNLEPARKNLKAARTQMGSKASR